MRIIKFVGVVLGMLFLSNGASAQTKYDSLWKKVDDLLMNKGLPKSALIEVDKIYSIAKRENNEGQLIKALVYQINLREDGAENANVKAIQFLEKELVTIKSAGSKAILTSVLAQGYWNYFQNNRWKLYNRTATTGFKKDDLATWGMADFHDYISKLYIRSLNEEKLLKETKLAKYDAVINKGNTRKLRPTLYDLLANRALEYFKNDERDVTKPAYAFVINQASAFDPAADFFARKFVTQDSSSMQHKALLLYQKLVAFHLYDAQPDALIDIDLQRLQFVYSKAVTQNKNELYFMAINHVAHQYQNTPAASQAWYLLAQWHADKARKFNAVKDTTGRFDYNIAEAICSKVLLQKEESEGKTNCYNLLNEIRTKDIHTTIEKVNLPGQPFRSLVKYRNVTQLHLRIVSMNGVGTVGDNRYGDEYWKKIISLKPLKSWSQALPDTKDHQFHTAEIKIDALPVGKYLVIGSADQDFSMDKNIMISQYVYISAISYINNGNEYFALHRETGKPLEGASVQVWNNYYDYKTRKTNNAKAEMLKADNKGYFKLNNVKDRNGLKIEMNYLNDHLFLDENYYSVYRSDENKDSVDYEEDNAKVFLFTDRSIYRPGQTMYFKGIVITKDFITGKSKIITGKKTKLFLNNANGEEVDSVELVTNEFGSYSGKFRLPENSLNGEFTLEDEEMDGSYSFSVEEYKRPRFYVEYEKLKGSYKINDSIKITGLAKAYAGNNIDGATVKYRVVRQPRFIYPWLWGKWGRPVATEMEIMNGTATTDKEGKFSITFKAIPDETLDKMLDPIFNYNIITDITDNNGETRSGTTDVVVSYKALQLTISLPMGASVPVDSLKHLVIETKNTNDEFVPASVQVRIFKLQQPGRLIRTRSWEQPDQFVMSFAEYTALFPHDEYNNEKTKENWPKGAQIVEHSDSSTLDKKFTIPNKGLSPGWYVVEASTIDKYGSVVKDVQYIQLYDEKSNKLPGKEYFTATPLKNSAEPGEKGSYLIGSSTSLFIIEQVQRGEIDDEQHRQTSSFNMVKLDNETKSFGYEVSENDRGGIGVAYLFVKDNRVYTYSYGINVPFTNKELTISYETYRDKTLPGSEEKWTLKLSGNKKEKVAAEMLVSMYDASLDQFKPHSWNLPDAWKNRYYYANWNSYTTFGNTESITHTKGNPYKSQVKTYDELTVSLQMINLQAIRSMKSAAPTSSEDAVGYGYVKKELAGSVSVVTIRGNTTVPSGTEPLYIIDGVATAGNNINPDDIESIEILKDANAVAMYGARAANGVILITTKAGAAVKAKQEEAQVRKNFKETAFFTPDLHTDETGNISFSFTMPESVTRWKFQGIAHTKDLKLGYTTASLVTQKDLMVQPNAPRFVREGDRMQLSAKIVNLSAKELTGTIELQLLDPVTMNPVDGIFQNMNANQYFTAEAGQSAASNFTMEVPYQYNSALLYRFIARTKADSAGSSISDGEEATLPVLSNTMLVTETMPLPVRGNTEKKISFNKLLQSGNSETLKHYGLTVEFTSNPAWNAVQALPYLAEYPYECAEQTFNRFYANALASMIANSSPRLKQVFEKWATTDTAALLSNLQKNEELKSVLLEETPWVLAAKTEAQQKKNIALLFNMMQMEKQLNSSLEKLITMQSPNGGFVWFKGGPDDRFITQYILSGIGHLKKLNAVPAFTLSKINGIVKAALPYLDARIKEDYDRIIASKLAAGNNHLGYTQVHFLYTRSFFPEYSIPATSLKAISYYRTQSQKYWLSQSRYMQGMIALQLFRTGDKVKAQAILNSLKEKAVVIEEAGMYWADNISGYFWYQAPVETQSLLIEAFTEITKNDKITGDLKTWLLKQKQTQNWRTTKATADACYALLLQGSNWLAEDPDVTIKLGDKIINSKEINKEEGTGYFKTSVESGAIKPGMGAISVKMANNSSSMPAWGAVYWQYFENLDKITSAATPLKLDKKLFIEKNSDRGPVLEPVGEGQLIKKGDKIKVRIELRVDRDMEYVHMKDMRASCMEPVNVLSRYKWQGALGYYETTKDASTSFFFNRLPKGTYVFEYALFANMAGNFSNGITSIQCMYAPEFASHSEGIRVSVE